MWIAEVGARGGLDLEARGELSARQPEEVERVVTRLPDVLVGGKAARARLCGVVVVRLVAGVGDGVDVDPEEAMHQEERIERVDVGEAVAVEILGQGAELRQVAEGRMEIEDRSRLRGRENSPELCGRKADVVRVDDRNLMVTRPDGRRGLRVRVGIDEVPEQSGDGKIFIAPEAVRAVETRGPGFGVGLQIHDTGVVGVLLDLGREKRREPFYQRVTCRWVRVPGVVFFATATAVGVDELIAEIVTELVPLPVDGRRPHSPVFGIRKRSLRVHPNPTGASQNSLWPAGRNDARRLARRPRREREERKRWPRVWQKVLADPLHEAAQLEVDRRHVVEPLVCWTASTLELKMSSFVKGKSSFIW